MTAWLVEKLSVQIGGQRHRVGRLWLPDGLHIWVGNRGVHLWLFGRPHIMWDHLLTRKRA